MHDFDMINLIPLKDNFSIYQSDIFQKIPIKIYESEFYSITKTKEELSIVTNCNFVFENYKINRDWKGFKIGGILDFLMVGIIHEITKPLKENGISTFVISTFNTDYIFVKSNCFTEALEIFKKTANIKIVDS